MGFQLEFTEIDNIRIQLPKQYSQKAWELAKKVVDMYFENPLNESENTKEK